MGIVGMFPASLSSNILAMEKVKNWVFGFIGWKVKTAIVLVLVAGNFALSHFYVEPALVKITEVVHRISDSLSNEVVVHADTTPAVQFVEMDAPILARIADCESGTGKAGTGHQFNKDGTVVSHRNNNGTYDIGKYQINFETHYQEIAKMHLNILTEAGNEEYAKFLYANRGTGDWDSSASCWRK